MSASYEAAFAESIADREAFWLRAAQAIDWATPPSRAFVAEGDDAAAAALVRRRRQRTAADVAAGTKVVGDERRCLAVAARRRVTRQRQRTAHVSWNGSCDELGADRGDFGWCLRGTAADTEPRAHDRGKNRLQNEPDALHCKAAIRIGQHRAV